MPQANSETLVSACTCDEHCLNTANKLLEEEIQPESFLLSKDAELDWFDNNSFLERKYSQRRNSFSSSTNFNPNSQRLSLRKSKASIIGFPKLQKFSFAESKNRKSNTTKLGNTGLFPKQSDSVKSAPTFSEPSSPKVSCMGRVRSKRERNRRLKKNRQKSTGVEAVKKKMTITGSGFFSSFRAIFLCNGKAHEPHALPLTLSTSRENDIRSRLPADDDDDAVLNIETEIVEIEPVGLGGMKRFASGRRSDPLI